MNRTQYIKQLKNGMFADRPTLEEAYEYAVKIAKASGSSAQMITGIHVLLNTIAKDLEKYDEAERARAEKAVQERANRPTRR